MSQPLMVAFVDCLGHEEAQACPFLSHMYGGKVISGVPRVTPQVVTSAITGHYPTQHGLLSPVRLDKSPIQRPMTRTIIEDVGDQVRTLNFEIPFTIGLSASNLVNIGGGIAGDQQQRPPQLNIPGPPGAIWKEDREKYLQATVDYVSSIFCSIRNLVRAGAFDVVFLSIRNVDSYGHFLYKDERERLIHHIGGELAEVSMMGDMGLLAFSDHGITDKKHTFYLNKWLQDQGYLDMNIWMPGVKKEVAKQEDPMDMLSVHSQFVHINEGSYFVSPDAFDSGIKILRDDAPVEELKRKLMETGMYDGIYTPEELWGDGEHREELDIDLVCDRADGVLVSGNVWPGIDRSVDANIYAQDSIRSGVHNRYGFWGANDASLTCGDFYPVSFYNVIKKFLSNKVDIDSVKNEARRDSLKEDMDESMVDRLADMGYA